MTRPKKISAIGMHMTEVRTKGRWTCIKYHDTEIVKFSKSVIRLDIGGRKTNTTKKRMNQASEEFGLGFGIFQRAKTWYVDFKGKEYEFEEDVFLMTRIGMAVEVIQVDCRDLARRLQ